MKKDKDMDKLGEMIGRLIISFLAMSYCASVVFGILKDYTISTKISFGIITIILIYWSIILGARAHS